MPIAQILQFDERLAMSRPRRPPSTNMTCVILQLHRPPKRRTAALIAQTVMSDEDRVAGRGRDPG
jgi:hypothetical protein